MVIIKAKPQQSRPSENLVVADELLTERDVSDRLHLSMKTLRNWRVRGEGPKFLKIGRLVRYRLSDVLAWEEASLRSSTSDLGGSHG
jgi:predicted DNA-binding transcriptional regulator AlpA